MPQGESRPREEGRLSESSGAQEAVFRFLGDPASHGLSGPVRRIDTANAVLFLAGGDAYKVKRAVKYPFMDLSTLEKRRQACEAEIAVNRGNAPGVYLGALPVIRDRESLRLGGSGEAVEWVVHMRRFDDNATLDRFAEREGLDAAVIDRLAVAIRRAHGASPRRDAKRAAQSLETYIAQNDAAFAQWPDLFPAAKAARLTQDSRLAFALARPVILARGALGLTRRCHGDLHLRNIALIDGEPVLFDAIEFSDDIATGDVLYDLAFLLMDLEERGLRAAASRLFNRYIAPEPIEAIAGLVALPFFMSLRAAIRAKVEAAGSDRVSGEKRETARALARRYFDLASELLRYAPARLVAVGGLSGAGKSALAGRLAPKLGRAPGALWLRSDVERKAMFGVGETVRLAADAYSAEATSEVYRRIGDKALAALRAGAAVVMDATFSSGDERAGAAAIAASAGVAFDGLFLEAPLETRIARVSARKGDPSDADAAIARSQRAEPLRESGWQALDAGRTLDEGVAAALKLLFPGRNFDCVP